MDPYTVTFETGRHYKVHKSYIWMGPLLALGAVILVVLLNGSSGWAELFMLVQQGVLEVDVLWAVLAVFGGFLLIWLAITGIYALAYKHMSFAFDPLEFSFYSGVFVKKRVHMPYEKVQSVNHRASLVQRLVGVCTVTIDSAGGSANKAVQVPYVTLQVAERLRNDLFVRKAAAAAGMPVVYVGDEAAVGVAVSGGAPLPPGAVPVSSGTVVGLGAPGSAQGGAPNIIDDAFQPVGDWRGLCGGAALAEEPVSFEYSLSNKELVLASLSHPGPLVAGLCVALAVLACLGIALTQNDWFSTVLLAFAVPAVLVAAIAVWLLGSLGVLLGYGGFKVRRRGSRIEVERGLITRNFSGIDVDRIQSIEVRQSLFRRLLRHSELSLGRIDTAPQDSNQSKESVSRGLLIHPFAANGSVPGLLDGLLPEFADRPAQDACAKLPPKALGRNIRRRCLWFNWMLWTALLCLGLWALAMHLILIDEPSMSAETARFIFDRAVGSAALIAAVAIGLSVIYYAVSAVLWARHSRYGWNDRYLLLRNDGLSTALCIIPRNKIQGGNTRDNPFQRRVGLTTLQAVTAAGVNHTTVQLLDVPAAEGSAYLEWLE